MVPLIVNCRDRLEPLLTLLAWLDRAGHDRIVLLDNDSAWPPLLDFYEQTSLEVVRLGENLGSQAPWRSGIVDRFAEPYAVTDPDIVPTEGCPTDLHDHLARTLAAHPDRVKVGVGIKTDDLPAHYRHREAAIACEIPSWQHEIEPGLFDADTDTTLAVYRPGQPFAMAPALRTGPPYVARHLSWYTDTANPTPEERFYAERGAAWSGASNWTGEELPRWLGQWAHLHRTGGRGLRSRLIRADQRTRRTASNVRHAVAYRLKRR